MALPTKLNSAQTLLIDADDTLWENNIYFERAITSFISFLNHHEYSPEQVRAVLDDVERECIISHGYGLHSFAHAIAEHPVEIMPEVPETLRYLSGRHRLILMTKGAIAEQSGKVERSGLREHFSAVEIVAEKNAATYREVVSQYALPPDSTWMIGNSPKSDINPAL